MIYLGIDTGGTFTDFVFLKNDELRVHKVLSTPSAPEKAIFQGIEELDLSHEKLTIIHGSTVATNAVLENKGVKTAYVTNTGFKDILTIGRQARRELYNLQPEKVVTPVSPNLCLEVDCRLDAQGDCLIALSSEKINAFTNEISALNVKSVAINLLFSYLNAETEQQLRDSLTEDLFVSISSEILCEIGEYERGMATWLNAWVGPLIKGYINRLNQGLGQSQLSVMQSSGETMSAEHASERAVQMLLSGPAGGLVGAQFMAELSGQSKLMTFDMGGTSTDVALLDGDIQLTNRGKVGHYPVAVPMVDMHTIGAGGGSIARVDEAGMLLVGPESAGAQPGPACYGLGGHLPTVTDANVVLGHVPDKTLLGGYLPIDCHLSQKAIQKLADEMDVSLEEAATGILEVANEHMARALRVISVQKGHNPTEFTLVSFGGAGGMHVCDLADELQMNKALVPAYGGVLSALGMLAAKPGRQVSQSFIVLLSEVNDAVLVDQFERMEQTGKVELITEGVNENEIEAQYSLDLRYQGQSNALNIPWSSITECERDFHVQHEKRYGHYMEIAVELVDVRVKISARNRKFDFGSYFGVQTHLLDKLEIKGNVFNREELSSGSVIRGPATIVEPIATTWIAEHWLCKVDHVGNLLLERLDA